MESRLLTPFESYLYDNLFTLVGAFAEFYFWFLFVFGACLCLWGFKKSKFKAYLVILVYFLSPFCVLVLTQISRTIHKEELEEMVIEEQFQEQLEWEKVEEVNIPAVTHINISFPIFETFLVVGLTLLTLKTKQTANKTLVRNSE